MKAYQSDTARRQQAERISMHTPPAMFAPLPTNTDPMSWPEIAIGAAALLMIVGVIAALTLGLGAA